MPAGLNERKGIMANTNAQRTRKITNHTQNTSAQNAASEAEQDTKPVSAQKKAIIPKDIDSSQYVIVRNGFQGKLIYKSRKTGEIFVWDGFGTEQEMELRELRNAKNSYKKFFINNWFMFDEDWIVDYLGVRQFYKNAIPIDDFDDIFTQKPTELKKTIAGLSDGQKRSVAYRAMELIAKREIDSLSVINALESALNIELIEK